jgi:hypothetical protein
MLSIRNAVIASGIGRTKLYQLIARGLIRAVKVDGKTLIEVQSLRDYLGSLPSVPIKQIDPRASQSRTSDQPAARPEPA